MAFDFTLIIVLITYGFKLKVIVIQYDDFFLYDDFYYITLTFWLSREGPKFRRLGS